MTRIFDQRVVQSIILPAGDTVSVYLDSTDPRAARLGIVRISGVDGTILWDSELEARFELSTVDTLFYLENSATISSHGTYGRRTWSVDLETGQSKSDTRFSSDLADCILIATVQLTTTVQFICADINNNKKRGLWAMNSSRNIKLVDISPRFLNDVPFLNVVATPRETSLYYWIEASNPDFGDSALYLQEIDLRNPTTPLLNNMRVIKTPGLGFVEAAVNTTSYAFSLFYMTEPLISEGMRLLSLPTKEPRP